MRPNHRFFRLGPALVAASAAVLTVPAYAAVIFSGDPNVSGGPSTLQITHDIDFTITSTGFAQLLVFDNWVGTSDGTLSQIADSPPSLLSYRIDGGATQSVPISGLLDNNHTAGSINSTDGFLWFSAISVVEGQTLTILAQTHTFGGVNSFNASTKQVFTGDVFLSTTGGLMRSSPVSLSSVPEPSEWAVAAGVGLVGFAVWRRRRVRAAAVV